MITKYFRTPEEEFEDQKIIFQRDQKHYDEIINSFPDVDITCQLDMSSIGKNLIRAFVYLPNDVDEATTRKLIKWLNKFAGKSEKNFRKDSGKVFYRTPCVNLKDEHGEYEYIVFLEGANPLNCEIKPVTKEVTEYEISCK